MADALPTPSIIATWLLVIVGHPRDIASIGGNPNPSWVDGYTKHFAFLYKVKRVWSSLFFSLKIESIILSLLNKLISSAENSSPPKHIILKSLYNFFDFEKASTKLLKFLYLPLEPTNNTNGLPKSLIFFLISIFSNFSAPKYVTVIFFLSMF